MDRENHQEYKIAKPTSLGNLISTRLADISNLPQRSKLLGKDVTAMDTKESLDELLKENMAMMKLLAEKNKIIELRGLELQKLRTNLQKFQLQNLQLAQTNSRILEERSSDKERLKNLQHELACIKGLLKARDSEMMASMKSEELEGQLGTNKVDRQQYNSKSLGPTTAEEQFHVKEKGNHSRQTDVSRSREPNFSVELFEMKDAEQAQCIETPVKKRHFSRQSAGLNPKELECTNEWFGTDDVRTVPAREKSNKRCCSRKQSAGFKSVEPECTEHMAETDVGDIPASPRSNAQIHGPCLAMSDSLVKEDREASVASSSETPEIQRPSDGRPSRRGSERVHSYKEIPLNVKMRRSDGADIPVSPQSNAEISLSKESRERSVGCRSETSDFQRPFVGRPSRRAAVRVHSYKEIPLNVKMRRLE